MTQVGTTLGSILFAGSKPSRAFLRRFTVRSARAQPELATAACI
jgi:hypothetical protein